LSGDLRGSETILIAEDEEMLRALAREFLMGAGYTVLEAPDGILAIETCKRHPGPIHLLLTDAIMPRMSGAELARRIKTLRPEIEVLCMSGYADDAVSRSGLLDPHVAFLQKPFSKETLLLKLREILKRRRQT
jgi:CheY-like chemotaxis protein